MRKSLLIAGISLLLFGGCGSNEVKNDGLKMTSVYSPTQSFALDRSSSANVKVVKSVSITRGRAVDLVLSKDKRYLYVATGEGGFETFDVSLPSSPKRIGYTDVPTYINRVELKNDILYASNVYQTTGYIESIIAYDVRNPYNSRYIGSRDARFTTPHYHTKKGAYIYELDNEGLVIFHKASNGQISLVKRVYLGDYAYALAVKDNYIYVANGLDGIAVIKTDFNVSQGRFLVK
jgi:hypothetical protein